MKRLCAILGVLVLALVGAGTAAAEEGGGAEQAAGQSAASGQSAGGSSGASQYGPTNGATSIRVLSPGNDGAVTQSNTTTAGAIAANDNKTSQSTDQSQTGGGYGSPYTQIAGQSAENKQSADADAKAVQVKPSNSVTSIRVLSPGNDGDVTQSNAATAGAVAANGNETKQSIDQTQAGSGHGSDATQIAGQDASSRQSAEADADAVQVKPENEATSIRVLSPGNGGDVTQSNDATAVAAALNGNETKQSVDQTQGGSGRSGSGDATQIAGQSASYRQSADADAKAVQVKPSNSATSIRVLSPGDDGDVTQSNTATAVGLAANGNETKQSIDQTQAGSGGSSTQVAGQDATNHQDADADATAVQWKPSNTASSIRVLSPGKGGDVTQSNTATALGIAANGNETKQSIDQTQGGSSKEEKPAYDSKGKQDEKGKYDEKGKGSEYVQIAGQEASNKQSADADAVAFQVKPSNTNEAIRVKSGGSDGDVTQSNTATALGIAANGNETKQSIDQTQGGSSKEEKPAYDSKGKQDEKGKYDEKGKGSEYVQIAGQEASNKQSADADAVAFQVKPSNTNESVRVLSPGHDGDVTQSNTATALGIAANGNETKQSIDQTQGGSSKEEKPAYDSKGKQDEKGKYDEKGKGSEYVQIAGQEASNKQSADADAVAFQVKPSNTNESVRVLSPGHDGDVTQSNTATALGIAANGNETEAVDRPDAGWLLERGEACVRQQGQEAGQEGQVRREGQGLGVRPGRGPGGLEQAVGRRRRGRASRSSRRTRTQSVRVLSRGHDGDVSQSNSATALAAALNLNETKQSIDQTQTGGGHGGSYTQIAGQGAWNAQRADADATAVQLGASNENAPIRVGSHGGGGSVEQSNDVGALALALNLNETRQYLDQTQSGNGSDALQVGGQGSWSEQCGGAMSRAIQGGMRKKSKR